VSSLLLEVDLLRTVGDQFWPSLAIWAVPNAKSSRRFPLPRDLHTSCMTSSRGCSRVAFYRMPTAPAACHASRTVHAGSTALRSETCHANYPPDKRHSDPTPRLQLRSALGSSYQRHCLLPLEFFSSHAMPRLLCLLPAILQRSKTKGR
jgi:hypothetical protein